MYSASGGIVDKMAIVASAQIKSGGEIKADLGAEIKVYFRAEIKKPISRISKCQLYAGKPEF